MNKQASEEMHSSCNHTTIDVLLNAHRHCFNPFLICAIPVCVCVCIYFYLYFFNWINVHMIPFRSCDAPGVDWMLTGVALLKWFIALLPGECIGNLLTDSRTEQCCYKLRKMAVIYFYLCIAFM